MEASEHRRQRACCGLAVQTISPTLAETGAWIRSLPGGPHDGVEPEEVYWLSNLITFLFDNMTSCA